MNVEDIRKLTNDETIAVTAHAKYRLQERNILLDDVEQAIKTGSIIEEYPDDKPFPSCLISGMAVDGRVLHTVVSRYEEFLYLITAYWPDSEKWTNNFTTRRNK